MTRRTLVSASEAIDEADSPVDGLEDGALAISSQSTGNVKGKRNFIISFLKLLIVVDFL